MSKIARLHKIEKIAIAVRKQCPWLIGESRVRLADVLYWALQTEEQAEEYEYYQVMSSLLDAEGVDNLPMWQLKYDDLSKQTDECLDYLCRLI